jgi:hypothetical protein
MRRKTRLTLRVKIKVNERVDVSSSCLINCGASEVARRCFFLHIRFLHAPSESLDLDRQKWQNYRHQQFGGREP